MESSSLESGEDEFIIDQLNIEQAELIPVRQVDLAGVMGRNGGVKDNGHSNTTNDGGHAL